MTDPTTPRAWVLLGSGGHARSLAAVIARRGDTLLAVAGFDEGGWSCPVLDDDAALAMARASGATALPAVGGNALRRRILASAVAAGVDVSPLVASTATVAADAVLGAGTAVLEHAHVGPRARLGAGTHVNTAAIVEHDVVIGEGTHVAPGAVLLGAAAAGDECLIGARACVLIGVSLGSRSVVGAGGVVVRDVPDGATVIGVPARVVAPRHD